MTKRTNFLASFAFLFLFIIGGCLSGTTQMRQLHIDTVNTNTGIKGISFYSPSEGYLAIEGLPGQIAYTNDSGRTLTKKTITALLFTPDGIQTVGLPYLFSPSGVHAINKDTLFLYGKYSGSPIILKSSNATDSFKVVSFNTSFIFDNQNDITDIKFTSDGNIGYAVDDNRIHKSTDRGNTWSVISYEIGMLYNKIEVISENEVYIYQAANPMENTPNTRVIKTLDGGATWFPLVTPTGFIHSLNFLDGDNGWLNLTSQGKGVTYYSNDRGATWILKSAPNGNSFASSQLHFVNDTTGYAIGPLFDTYITRNAGRDWSKLVRDNTFTSNSLTHSSMFFRSWEQFWVGGPKDFLEMTTNRGGIQVPPQIMSFFPAQARANTSITIVGDFFEDVQSVSIGGVVSSPFTVISRDTILATLSEYAQSGPITVTTSSGTITIPGFKVIPTLHSFTPTKGTHGTVMTLNGSCLSEVNHITVGGIPVQYIEVNSPLKLTAYVGPGASGDVFIQSPVGSSTRAGFTYVPPPIVQSVSPLSGPVGTTVTITGQNFNPSTSGNAVFFGAIPATVTAANTTSLTVTVPAGSQYAPITVVCNELLAHSRDPFLITFPNGGSVTEGLFASAETYTTGTANHGIPFSSLGDLDGDQKPDMVVSNPGEGALSIFRNTSTGSAITFAPPQNLLSITGPGPLEIRDMDGDGKLDLTVVNWSVGTISILLNQSTPGNMQFASAYLLPTPSNPYSMKVADMDGDGKSDIIVSYQGQPVTSIFRNRGEVGALSFHPEKTFSGLGGTDHIIRDLNQDGKPEMIVANATTGQVLVSPNQSTPTQLIMGTPLTYTFGSVGSIDAGDLNGDGKLDIIATNPAENTVIILKNTSTGTVSLEEVQPVSTQNPGQSLQVNDVDGDGRPDIITHFEDINNWGIFKNLSNLATIQFGPQVNLASYGASGRITLTDLNADQKVDAVIVNTANLISVFKNTASPAPYITSISPTIGEAGTQITINGFQFTNITQVEIGGSPAASFTVNSPTSITAIVGSGGTGNVKVSNNFGTSQLGIFVHGLPLVVESLSTYSGQVGSILTIQGQRFSTVPQENIVYFGTVRAKVIASTSTSIQVEVPFGSQEELVSVTKGNRTAWSKQPFITLFEGGSGPLSKTSFAPRTDHANPFFRPLYADLDEDGKLDVTSISTGKILIHKNTSITGNISFQQALEINMPIPTATYLTQTGDLDGDGKIDIMAWIINSSSFFFLRNNSVQGQFSFEDPISFTVPFKLSLFFKFLDIDSDGKADLSSVVENKFIIHHNISQPGSILFRSIYGIKIAPGISTAKLQDINEDGKPDLILHAGKLLVYTNIGLPGNPKFSPAFSYPSTYLANQGSFVVKDMNNDQKPDIVFNTSSTSLALFQNTSSGASINFAAPQTITGTPALKNASVKDLDGNTLPDIYYTDDEFKIKLLKNISSPGGSFDFGAPVSLEIPIAPLGGNQIEECSSVDLDNDSRPDAIIAGNTFTTVYRNIIGKPDGGPMISTFFPIAGSNGTSVTIKGKNLGSTTSATIGNQPVSSLSVVSNHELRLVVGNGNSGEIRIKSANGEASTGSFTNTSLPVIESVSDTMLLAGKAFWVNGANLSNVNQVTIGGISVNSFEIISDISLRIIPGSSGIGELKVFNPNGSATYGQLQILNPPVITGFSPTTAGTGTTVTITGSDLQSVKEVYFENRRAARFQVVSPTRIDAVVAGGNSGSISVHGPIGSDTLAGYVFPGAPVIHNFYPKTATTGTVIKIIGNNLGGVNAVRFETTPAASFTIISPNLIEAVVGNGGTGKVFLTNASGTVSQSGFVYHNANTPVITQFYPTVTGPGATVTIDGYNFTNVSSVQFGGSPAASFTVESSTRILAVTGSNASGAVSVTTANGNTSANGFILSNAPVVSEITPLIGSPGATISIKGFNFGTNAPGLMVYFGATKANVVRATNNELEVVVPHGATPGPVSVMNNNLIGISSQWFQPQFHGYGTNFSKYFSFFIDSIVGIAPLQTAIADLDQDGRPDIGVANQGTDQLQFASLGILRNTSQDSTTKIGTLQTFQSDPYFGNIHKRIFTEDLTNDGKLDIICSNSFPRDISIYKNNSSTGTISLASAIDLGDVQETRSTACDLDGDGKSDIVYSKGSNGMLHLYRNTGTGGNLSFAAVVQFNSAVPVTEIKAADIDGDGKPDLVICGSGAISVVRNLSNTGNLQLASPVTLSTGQAPKFMAFCDLDNDGKLDIVTANAGASATSLIRNQSQPGYIALSVIDNINLPISPISVQVDDIDGNGKPDLLFTAEFENKMVIALNESEGANIAFNTELTIPIHSPNTTVNSGDVNGDTKPEIILANKYSNTISIIDNGVPQAITIRICPFADTVLQAGQSGSAYQWQFWTGKGFQNLSDNSNFTGTQTGSLHILDFSPIAPNRLFRCMIDKTREGKSYYIETSGTNIQPTVTISGRDTVTNGQNSTISATPQDGGSLPTYLWQDSTSNHTWQTISGLSGALVNYSPVATGVKIRCIMISNDPCAYPDRDTSNAITFTVNAVTSVINLPATSEGIRAYPVPVKNVLTIDSLKISDQWTSLRIIGADGKQGLPLMSIANKTRVQVDMSRLTSGAYTLVLYRKQKAPVYLKVVKQ